MDKATWTPSHPAHYLFSFFVTFVLASCTPSPSDKESSLLAAHMQMSVRQEEHKHQAALFHHAAAERSSNLFHGAVDSKHFMTAAGAQIPPPMQYMGMPHLSNWQLAAH